MQNSPQPLRHFQCPDCQQIFFLTRGTQDPSFCAFCGKKFFPDVLKDQNSITASESAAYVKGHTPIKESIQFSIGDYQVLSSIGRGGMGEVFLAYDPACGRRIALKRIRADLVQHKQMHNRFLQEAQVTSQLTHPSIIPIYTIHEEETLAYYTMPYVEGETLKQILRKIRQEEAKGIYSSTGAIPSLVRIFLNICQAIAYAHAKEILHRDLKPENIIVGKYGETMILDWGLAKPIHQKSTFSEDVPEQKQERFTTRIGKVVGTISYMAPERALGQPATIQTDIYSLGAILYQILTLKAPFYRKSLKDFRANISKEVLIDPVDIAPYRDVPKILARITTKCLDPLPEKRYASADDLIRDLENYMEGRAEWFQMATLQVDCKNDWEFQENVLISEYSAITRSPEEFGWFSLMISKESFANNLMFSAKVRIGDAGHGIGFLFNVPESSKRIYINDGYCLWLGSDRNRSSQLSCSAIEVMHVPEVILQRNQWHLICVEKRDNTIYVYIDDILQFSYVGQMPMLGTHVGLLSRDADFEITDFSVFVGSQNIMVNCLAVPDAFLAQKDYATALSEYRRIGYAFPGRAEGREAMFRAGVTLIEQGKTTTNLTEAHAIFDRALDEFEKLHQTPGAPLEYLGKSLVYQALGDYEEEMKCLELSLRRYPKHPLLHLLQEQIIYRMHESSRSNRQGAYHFLLLAARHLPSIMVDPPITKLTSSLKRHWEPLNFLVDTGADPSLAITSLAIVLAFWLNKSYVLEEVIDELVKKEPFPSALLFNAFICLVKLGNFESVQEKLLKIDSPVFNKEKYLLNLTLQAQEGRLADALAQFSSQLNPLKEIIFIHLLEQALDKKQTTLVHDAVERLTYTNTAIDCCQIWAYLLEKNLEKAGELLHAHPFEQLSNETSLLHFLFGCWLYATEGKELANIHFSGVLDTAYPRTWSLASHYLIGKLSEEWFKKAFIYEKCQLEKQLSLFNSP